MRSRIRVKCYDRFNDEWFARRTYKNLYRFIRSIFMRWKGGNGVTIHVDFEVEI